MLDYIIVFIYTTKNTITSINLESIKKNNPNIPIIDICVKDFENIHYSFLGNKPLIKWSVRELWYGCDNIFLYWYLANTNIRAKNYILVEWDTYAHNVSFIDFFGSDIIDNTGITSSTIVCKKDSPHEYWFFQQKNNAKFNSYGIDHCKKYSPMSCTTISNDCVMDIINHIKHNPECNSIYIETKFATIGSFLGYSIKKYSSDFSKHISYHENICEKTIIRLKKNTDQSQFNGIFHPVKKFSIYEKYFMEKPIVNNNTIKIISATYGACLDIKKDLGYLLARNNRVTIDNDIAGDPAPYKEKSLYLVYEKNGQIYHKTIPEYSYLDIDTL